MRILVTGGAGFIGSNLVGYWLNKYPGDSITVLDKLTYAGHKSSLSEYVKLNRFKFVKGDICNRNLVGSLVQNTDLIIHLAAESHVDRSLLNPFIFVKTNVLGTQVLLDAALKHKISRFHHVSTDEVFGDLPLSSKIKFSEQSIYSPHSPYSASKAASDYLVLSYFHSFDLNVTISNCSNNYGPNQDPEKFIPRMITNLLVGDKIKIYGKGLNIRDWLFVTDHCRAIDMIVHKSSPGESYCIGGQSRLFTNLEIAEKILKLMNKDPKLVDFVSDRPGHDRKYAVNWSKINHKLGWSPEYNLSKGLQETISWYSGNKFWWKPLKIRAESIY